MVQDEHSYNAELIGNHVWPIECSIASDLE